MLKVEWGENPPQLVYPDDDLNLEGFRDVIVRTRSLVADSFRWIRFDIPKILPPIIICTGRTLNEALAVATRNSTRENNDKRSLANYEAHSNTIVYSQADLDDLWKDETHRNRLLAVVNTEEHIHALTTSQTPQGDLRIGFTHAPSKRGEHGLIPGEFYWYVYPKLTFDEPSFRENADDLRLTENATKLAVHLMLRNLIPSLEWNYNYVLLAGDHYQGIIEKHQGLLDSVLTALYKGRRRLLEKSTWHNGTDLLTLLSDTGLKTTSISHPSMSPVKIFEIGS